MTTVDEHRAALEEQLGWPLESSVEAVLAELDRLRTELAKTAATCSCGDRGFSHFMAESHTPLPAPGAPTPAAMPGNCHPSDSDCTEPADHCNAAACSCAIPGSGVDSGELDPAPGRRPVVTAPHRSRSELRAAGLMARFCPRCGWARDQHTFGGSDSPAAAPNPPQTKPRRST